MGWRRDSLFLNGGYRSRLLLQQNAISILKENKVLTSFIHMMLMLMNNSSERGELSYNRTSLPLPKKNSEMPGCHTKTSEVPVVTGGGQGLILG